MCYSSKATKYGLIGNAQSFWMITNNTLEIIITQEDFLCQKTNFRMLYLLLLWPQSWLCFGAVFGGNRCSIFSYCKFRCHSCSAGLRTLECGWLLLTGLHDQIVDCVDTGVAKFLISKEGA